MALLGRVSHPVSHPAGVALTVSGRILGQGFLRRAGLKP
jgi:hypothetical protein